MKTKYGSYINLEQIITALLDSEANIEVVVRLYSVVAE